MSQESPPDPSSSVEGVSAGAVEADRERIRSARARGPLSVLAVYTRLSGPGWLQSAITLGGGSLAGSLYLGVLAGYGLMWMQPLAMVLGVIMLSAIAYVTLSTGERPFASINRHVNPVLGWGWAIATLLANIVWCMPQFALATAALRQNLFPQFFSTMTPEAGKLLCAAGLFVVAGGVIWFYDSGGWGIRLFETILKGMVGVVVLCFFGVVVKMTLNGVLDWSAIAQGFVPDLRLLSEPSDTLRPYVAATGEFADFWSKLIVTKQQDVIITAVATAVGINMTFLLPYSTLAKGWDRDFRGLATFDLATGLFVPFLLATSCVVLSAAHQFHAQPAPGLVELYEQGASDAPEPAKNLIGSYNGLLDQRLASGTLGAGVAMTEEERLEARAALPQADRVLAAMLVKRDADNLANSLERIAGKATAQTIFGIGVLGMGVSTIIILMLINGFTVCEMCNRPAQGHLRRLGAFIPAVTGAIGMFFWQDAAVYLAVPTSMFGMCLLPIAYWTFFCMMNSQTLMGESLPRGMKRVVWNVLMLLAASLATFGSFWSIRSGQYPTIGFACLGIFILLAIIVHFVFPRRLSGTAEQLPAIGQD